MAECVWAATARQGDRPSPAVPAWREQCARCRNQIPWRLRRELRGLRRRSDRKGMALLLHKLRLRPWFGRRPRSPSRWFSVGWRSFLNPSHRFRSIDLLVTIWAGVILKRLHGIGLAFIAACPVSRNLANRRAAARRTLCNREVFVIHTCSSQSPLRGNQEVEMIFAALPSELSFCVYHDAFEVCGLDHVEVFQLVAMKGTP